MDKVIFAASAPAAAYATVRLLTSHTLPTLTLLHLASRQEADVYQDASGVVVRVKAGPSKDSSNRTIFTLDGLGSHQGDVIQQWLSSIPAGPDPRLVVTRWYDQSGNGRHLEQLSQLYRQPLYMNNRLVFGLDPSAGANQKRVCLQQSVTTDAVSLEDVTVVAGLVPTGISNLGSSPATGSSLGLGWRALDPIVRGAPQDDGSMDWSLVLGSDGAFGESVGVGADIMH